jgi:glycosyltransferase involved in cell wall biosynthesis
MSSSRIRLLSLTNCLLEYRIPVYNLLSTRFELTVAHYGNLVDDSRITFKQIKLTKRSFGPFIYFKENIRDMALLFDAVIALGELRILPFMRLGFVCNRKFSLTYWNIGVSASYSKEFDKNRNLDILRFYLLNRADSIVFYSDYPIKRYVEDGGIDMNKLFVANNTVEVLDRIPIKVKKDYFLFVGTLYREKKIFDLLEAYLKAFKLGRIKPLIIIGDGDQKALIHDWIKFNGLEGFITLLGSIFDQNALKVIYQNAIALISPGQAGLTVLNSFAYGVPFVTSVNAITGGEYFNIVHLHNGLTYEGDVNTLSSILVSLSTDDTLVYKMGINAQNFYFNERTIDMMVSGLVDSIMYAKSCC